MAPFEIAAWIVVALALLFGLGFVVNNALWTPEPVAEEHPTLPIRMPHRRSS